MPRCCGAPLISAADGNGSPQSLGLQIQDGNPRNKTALAPGHSLMDWIRLGNSGVDLTGVGGVSRVVTLSELANHNKQTDAWIAIRGIVFNVTRYMDFHPGGVDELMRGVGKDATKLFENVHAWVNYQSILQKCIVGKLSRGSSSVASSAAASLTEKSATNANNCSSVTLGFSKSSAAPKAAEENLSDLPNINMNWRQTSNSITLFYQTMHNYPGMYYQLQRLSDSKLIFRLILEKHIITHELELIADVEWPPTCKSNFETMQVDFTFTKRIREVWKSQGKLREDTLSRGSVNKRTYKEYEVLSNTSICKLVNLLVLRAKDSLELIPIGRHIEVKMNIMGMEVSRSYTPVPPCLHPEDMAPNYKPDCICLMIKRYPNGALSPSITTLRPGQTLTMSNGLGAFVIESFDRYPVIHMLAGGTGLTAMLGIIQRALARRNVKLINLLNFNKDEDNMFYVSQLDKVSMEKKFKVAHILSQAGDKWKGKRGVVSDELLKELIGEYSLDGCIFTCGPKGFMLSAKKCIQKLGWASYQIYEFDS
ncbi:cytochrome b5 reductase 4 isoform X2 [Harpegnathos saltator]|uniref:Cytochrome b5 reductase 4 n=1 Tax=Harpegnathos saltator TaxID=610380 RepID=E2B9U4_HARSA|nr:cytochrome b5 reductase 4 isoform X2 [Harpegnathos saltator]XP_025155611.1 cytochrome b5 reductase 4 isoform X2 [Harpegnathos saltator]XP_025155612.1 cytochrome b5 reductase 4 isoform X2 [Harpegnathos saltator]XP_025155613.1 cytochrome b5 reductase 4 isoform X2 [Harpegnathos saltator]XP_025155614.1 cytochrome b5 reductase 4 isoform X2 [Harpegnathos saltator]EFN87531.1 Cytochrome b5 reductase 4 [Harpegnathos saltator]